MLRLFDPHAGIGISFLRKPIGSSDLTRGCYTYDDNSSDRADASLPHFSIDHDLADVLPFDQAGAPAEPAAHTHDQCLEPARLDEVERIAGGRGGSAQSTTRIMRTIT
jgi:hypothetical protein